jgi:alcohol dehydrogenase class IV
LRNFVHIGLPSRVIFGAGAFAGLAAEVERLGMRRALVLSTPGQRRLADEVARRAGERVAGIFSGAVMHVPVDTVLAARAAAEAVGADGCIAIGGGSTIGLGKALALDAAALAVAAGEAAPGSSGSVAAAERGHPWAALATLAIPTTFSGSEMTPVFGVTARGQKRTGRDERVLPRAVIYDPELLATLPAKVAGPSGVNGIAHCVEALYARDRNPITSLMAEEGIRALVASLPRVVADDADREARAEARGEALYGAWLAGSCLAATSMALHHKLCHLLGGRYDLPHAETHTVLLPHAVQYNRDFAVEAMARLGRALGGADPAVGLFELARRLHAPLGLRQLGLPEAALDEAADLAMMGTYDNPRPLDRSGLRQLLQAAWEGTRPGDAA